MTRFFTVLAAVALAGAIYVATAPGSQTTTGPTLRQFRLLEAKVAKLQTAETNLKKTVTAEGFLLSDCMNVAVPIGQFGDNSVSSTIGYTFTNPDYNSGVPFLTTALDVTANDDPNALWITGSFAPSACAADLAPSLRKLHRLAGTRLPGAALHSFSAHTR
jgi:hypothetical protein